MSQVIYLSQMKLPDPGSLVKARCFGRSYHRIRPGLLHGQDPLAVPKPSAATIPDTSAPG